MAYDPNDPKDKAIVEGLIKTAVEARETELADEHEEDKQGLINKNRELTEKLKKARQGDGSAANDAEIERLERELDDSNKELAKVKSELRTTARELTTRTTERDTAVTERDTERTEARGLLVNNALTDALVGVNVGQQFLEDVTASLSRQVEVREVDGKRQVFAGDKPLSEFVKEWSLSDKGKHYVVARNNSGGNVKPGDTPPPSGDKKISEMNLSERNAHFNAIGKEAFDAQIAAEKHS